MGSTELEVQSTLRVGLALDRLLEPLEPLESVRRRPAAPVTVPEKAPARRSRPRRQRRTAPAYVIPEALAPYERYSSVSGELAEPPADQPYRVEFRQLPGTHSVRSYLLVGAALLFVGGFLVWLMLPSHWPHVGNGPRSTPPRRLMTVNTGLIGWFAFINVATLCRARSSPARPGPGAPPSGHSGSPSSTTIVPDGRAAGDGSADARGGAARSATTARFDVWLLDEGDDPEVKEMCARAGRAPLHAARGGALEPARPGRIKARSKHGNYNAWLDAHGDDYDFFALRRPRPRAAARTSPSASSATSATPTWRSSSARRSTATTSASSPRAAESQQFLFHSLLQRAGNRSRTPDARRHEQRRAASQRCRRSAASRTRSPRTWRPASRSTRHAIPRTGAPLDVRLHARRRRRRRGTGVVHRLLQPAGALVARHRPGRSCAASGGTRHGCGRRALFHYTLLIVLLPDGRDRLDSRRVSTRLVYFALGAGGVVVHGRHLADALRRRRRAADRPLHLQPPPQRQPARDDDGTAGAPGMVISALSAPIYATSLVAAALRPQGWLRDHAQGRRRAPRHASARSVLICAWAAVFAIPLAVSFPLGHDRLAMRLWSFASLLVCLLPVGIWLLQLHRDRRRASGPVASPTEPEFQGSPALVIEPS